VSVFDWSHVTMVLACKSDSSLKISVHNKGCEQ
jgi:hypothetical protein